MREGRHRSSISRAYYAAYCAATHEIVKKPTIFAHGWNNPPHEKVPAYIQSNRAMRQAAKDTVNELITILRLFRVDADYRPSETVNERIARDCIRNAALVQQELWGTGT